MLFYLKTHYFKIFKNQSLNFFLRLPNSIIYLCVAKITHTYIVFDIYALLAFNLYSNNIF